MKKKIISLLLICTMICTFAACKKDEPSEEAVSETIEQVEYDPFDYVTINGDYKGIEVTLAGDYEVTAEKTEEYINSKIQDTCPVVEDKEQTEVQDDSIINIDYVGSIDDVPFTGGSAENVTFDMAANGEYQGNSYIEGFSDGLVGHKVGEEVACDVTFPENYGSEELAGKQVVFTFKINWICKEITVDDLTDEYVTSNFDSENVTEFKSQMKDELKEELDSRRKSDIRTNVVNTVINMCEVNGVPEELLQGRMDLYMSTMEDFCSSQGYSVNDFVTNNYGMDLDTFKSNIQSSMTESMEQELIFEAIAKQEGIEINEDEYLKYANDMVESYGMATIEELYSNYDMPGFSGERYVRLTYITEQAVKFCIDNAVVSD